MRPGDPWHKVKPEEKGEKRIIFLCRFSRGCCGGGESSGSAKKGPRTKLLLLRGKGRNQVLSVSLVCASPPPPNWDLRTTQPSLSPLPPPRPIIAPLPPSPPTPPSNRTWQAQALGPPRSRELSCGEREKWAGGEEKLFSLDSIPWKKSEEKKES